MTQNTTQPYTDEARESDNIQNADKENGGKTFTQSEVEKLINERIKRERKVNKSLLPIKQLLRKMADEGVLSGESYSEMAQNLVKGLTVKAEGVSETAQQDGDEENAVGTAASSDDGFEPETQNETAEKSCAAGENGSEEKEEKVTENDGEKEEAQNTQQVSLTFSDIASLKAKYPSADMNLLFDGGKFERFAKGKTSSLEEIFDDYCAFIQEFSPSGSFSSPREYEENTRDATASSLASTAFSSYSGTSPVSDGLTKQQMEIAKSAGLSYREYAQLLSSIPKSVPRITN